MLIQVVGDLQQKPKSGSTSSSAVAENCLYIIANVSCKVYLSNCCMVTLILKLMCHIMLAVSLQLLSVASSKRQRDSAASEEEELHVSVLLEHTMAAVEKFLPRKRKKLKPSSATSCNTAPLEVIHEHPVLMSTLALLLHNNPQLVSERYIFSVCMRDEEASINNCRPVGMKKLPLSCVAHVKSRTHHWSKNLMFNLHW